MNPGPGAGNSQVKQTRLADYGIGNHVDARADWCRATGFEFQKVRGDKNCLYGALGRSVGKDQSEVRAEIAHYAGKNWDELKEHLGVLYSCADIHQTSDILILILTLDT